MVLNRNAFGDLVRAYRKQRGWTQEELAERWGYTRGYVSLIEAGKKKLDSVTQVVRLADILDIPQEKLEAIGRGIPTRQIKATSSEEADNAILQMLLAPGRDMVKVSYIAWLADQHPAIEANLQNLVMSLNRSLTSYSGEFVKPAQQLLGYAHQMLGKIAFDRMDFVSAGGHFSEMIDLGQELNDADIIALGMVRQGDVLRKRARYETALKTFEAAKPFAAVASLSVQGALHTNMARAFHYMGNEQKFSESINRALEIASSTEENIDSLANGFNFDLALQFQASGYTALWKPEKAIEIYRDLDKRPFRALRDQGAYTIEKARAYLEAGYIDVGIELALKGLQLVSEYRSRRHVARLDATYNRLRVLPVGKDRRLNTLRDALRKIRQETENW
ncbi:MAG TPA: helix-turn-helix transcriptional regulator [Ktedonobacteraceae bacterium]|nr:helix-turn-helix transcriptional regulator [Ktedonobacteraceae bacterium]